MKLKPLIASMALLASGVALASGFTPPEAAPAAVDRLELQRNHNGRFSEPTDWFRRITLSGEINVDGMFSNRTPMMIPDFSNSTDVLGSNGRYGRHSSSDIGVDDANIYLGAVVNDWVMANLDLQYNDSMDGGELKNNPRLMFTYQDHNTDTLDEAYLTIANFRQSPIYLLLGKEYVPFGYYVRHPVIAPLTQLMTQTNATAAQLGFVDVSGFNASVFAFRDKALHFADGNADSRRIQNGGAQIGYHYEEHDMGFNLDVSWLAKMNDVDYLANPVVGGTGAIALPAVQHEGIDGWAAMAQGHYLNFDAEVQYATAGRDFSASDLTFNGEGAKPRAWTAVVGYTFPVMDHNTRLSVSYQSSKKALAFGNSTLRVGLPKNRWEADYAVNVWKNTDVILAYVRDKDYGSDDTGSAGLGVAQADDSSGELLSVTTNGTGRVTATGVVRVSAKFA